MVAFGNSYILWHITLSCDVSALVALFFLRLIKAPSRKKAGTCVDDASLNESIAIVATELSTSHTSTASAGSCDGT